MRKLGIGRPNKRLRPTENVPGIGTSNSQSQALTQGQNVLHSTAIDSPSKRIALVDPLDSDDEILPESQTPTAASGPRQAPSAPPPVRSQFQNISQNLLNDMRLRPPPMHPTPTSESLFTLESQRRRRKAPVVINASTGFPDFSNVLQECGFILASPSARNYLKNSELLFRKQLSEWLDERLAEEPDGPMNVGRRFIAALKTFLSTQVNFRHSMTPTQHPDFVPQKSLLYNLLCIPALQPTVLGILFPALAEVCYSAGRENQETVDTLVSIVHSLRWLPKIMDVEKFVSTILDFVKSGTSVAQKQLISSLPEIIPEDKHQRIADTLRSMLERPQEPEVVPAIMDCFSSLNVPSKEWMKVHEAALSQMFNSPLGDYPAFFAFLFRTEESQVLSETITKMRASLQITPLGEKDDTKCAIYMVEIVEKIRFCSAVNRQLTPTWVKQVRADIDAGEVIQPIDLIMLLIFAEYSKPPITTLNHLFNNKDLAIKLFDDLLKNNLPILNQVFKTLLNICCLAVRGKDTHPVMEHVLINLFLRLSLIEGQEIAFRLSNFLMESTSSRQASLRILTQLAEKNPSRLLHFSAHLMSIVISMMSYPSSQIKQLMNVLAILTNVSGNRSSEAFATELAIFLRKQLTNFTGSTRCFGVLGALATAKQLCAQDPTKRDSVGNKDKIQEFLDLVWSLVDKEEEACLLFFDELSEIAEQLPASICKKFRKIMSKKFQDNWTTSERTSNRKDMDEVRLRLSESFDANRELEEKEQLYVTFREKPLGMSPLVVPSHLRLVGRLVSAEEKGDLSLIDAILGCPVIIPDIEVYYKDTKKLRECSFDQRKKLGLYLLLSVNFFRESISAFIKQADPELRIKLWLRLANVVYLQQLLVTNFAHFPLLPKAYIEEINVTHRASSGTKKQKQRAETTPKKKTFDTKSSKPATKKGKKDGDNADTTKTTKKATKEKEKDKEVESRNKNVELENQIMPKFIMPHLRRLDLPVFGHMLRHPLNDGPEIDFSVVAQNITSSPTQQLQEVSKLTPETLTLLLAEIHLQTKDPNTTFDAVCVKNIVPSICTHLDNIESLYERGKISEDDSRFESCFRLLLHTFCLLLERVKARPADDQNEVFQRIVEIVADRIKDIPSVSRPASEAESIISARVKHVAEYFANFSLSVRSPSTAVEHLLLLKHFDDLAKDEQDTVQHIEKVSKAYLTKNWKLSPAQTETILKTWLRKTDDPMKIMKDITKSLIPNDGKDFDDAIPINETFQSCSKANFHMWYSTLLSSLASHVYKYGRKLTDVDEVYTFWNAAILILKDLVMVIQEFRNNLFFSPLLKYTRQFFEAAGSHCVKKLPALLARDANQTKLFIKNLQHVTRKIQVVCSHSKVAKDTTLLKFVPLLRKVLEILVFRVRETLVSSGLASAFTLGSLKHKNIDGELINSQPYDVNVEDSNDEEASDNELITNAAQLPNANPPSETSDVEMEDEDDDEVETHLSTEYDDDVFTNGPSGNVPSRSRFI